MKRFLIFALLVLALPVAAWAQAAPKAASNGSVTDLGSLGQQGSIAYAVSAKGEVVVGASIANVPQQYWRAFRWTVAGGIQDLDTNSNDSVYAHANGVSADTNVVVGDFGRYPDCNPNCAFLWTVAGGFDLLYPPTGWYAPVATGVSKDGGVLVGYGQQASGFHSFRWTGVNGMVDIGALKGGTGSQAFGVSQDGKVVVGSSGAADGSTHAYRWTQAGMTDLGFFAGGDYSEARGASTNGSVVVGSATTQGAYYPIAFRWTKATGKVALGVLPSKWWSVATGVSADGKTVVGYSGQNCCDWEAFRWTAATGMQSVNDWLADVGVNATGLNFYSAYAVTANGNGVVGQLTSGDACLALVKANKTATPTYSPKPGTYHSAQSVTINDMAPNAAIYYTTDGTTPTTNSTPYTGPVQVSVTTTIKSIAVAHGYPKSAVATGVYKIQ
ncbi:MAG: chitobiase/beta-hexosaminidase C-terminal domain-containing protein [Terriglobales bacterium]